MKRIVPFTTLMYSVCCKTKVVHARPQASSNRFAMVMEIGIIIFQNTFYQILDLVSFTFFCYSQGLLEFFGAS